MLLRIRPGGCAADARKDSRSRRVSMTAHVAVLGVSALPPSLCPFWRVLSLPSPNRIAASIACWSKPRQLVISRIAARNSLPAAPLPSVVVRSSLACSLPVAPSSECHLRAHAQPHLDMDYKSSFEGCLPEVHLKDIVVTRLLISAPAPHVSIRAQLGNHSGAMLNAWLWYALPRSTHTGTHGGTRGTAVQCHTKSETKTKEKASERGAGIQASCEQVERGRAGGSRRLVSSSSTKSRGGSTCWPAERCWQLSAWSAGQVRC